MIPGRIAPVINYNMRGEGGNRLGGKEAVGVTFSNPWQQAQHMKVAGKLIQLFFSVIFSIRFNMK